MTALILLLPGTPMLFQGQKFWSSSPFYFFADHQGSLAEMVRKGRMESLSHFPSLADPACRDFIPAPDAIETFERCRLDWAEAERNDGIVALHRDILRLRRDEPALRNQASGALDGTVLGSEAFRLRFFSEDGRDALLLVKLAATSTFGASPTHVVE